MDDNIILQTGETISDCLNKLKLFCERDASHPTYDLAMVEEDNSLTMSDVQLANYMGARMGSKVMQLVMNRVENINSTLANIPAGLELTDNGIPWAGLEDLFRATLGSYIRPARATKILHKKRPRLIPILDSVVVSYCHSANRVSGGDEASRMVECVRTIKTDIERNLGTFRKLIAATTPKLTVVRVHDILVWAYTGEYQKLFGVPPIWQR